MTIHAAACRWHWIDTPTTPAGISGHLLLLTGISITGWGIASAYATWCNFWLRRITEVKEDAIRKKQAFYAGVLHATTLVAAVAATIGLATLIRYCYPATVTTPLVPTAAAIGLALLFGLLAVTYRSAGPSYFGIVAMCLASYSAVGLVPSDDRGAYDGLALATIALVLGLLRNGVYAIWPAAADPHSEEHALASPRSYQAERAVWMQQLWAVPLHHASVLLPFAAIATCLGELESAQPSLGTVRIVCVRSSLALGDRFTPRRDAPSLHSRNRRNFFGQQTALIGQSARGERVVLMLLSIVTAYFAIHATVQSYLLAPSIVEGGQIIAWHTVVAGLTSMVGWGVATSYAAWCGVCLCGKSEDDATLIRQRLFFYGGLLYHLTAVAAIIDLGVLSCVSMGQNLNAPGLFCRMPHPRDLLLPGRGRVPLQARYLPVAIGGLVDGPQFLLGGTRLEVP